MLRDFKIRSRFLLAAIGLASILIYAGMLLRFPLLALYTSVRLNLNLYTRSAPATGIVMTIAMLMLFAGYAVGAWILRVSPPRSRLEALLIVGVPVVCVGILVMVQPVTSIDLYDYMFRGRMLARYGANTFVRVPIEFQQDPLYRYVGWRLAVTAYGPLWEGLSWLTAWLAGEAPIVGAGENPTITLLRLLLAYKALAMVGLLLCSLAIWVMLRRAAPQQRWLGLYLWLWNPLVLWESVGVGHNDVWMALMIVLAAGLLARRQASSVKRQETNHRPASLILLSLASFLALTSGGLIKYVALIFGPLALAAALRRLPTWRARVGLIALSGLVCSALAVAAYAHFWVGVTTLENFKARENLYTGTWITVLHGFLQTITSKEWANAIASRTALGLLIVGVLWQTWRSWRAPNDIAQHMLGLLLWFLIVCNPWFQPWYLVWLAALAALQPGNTRLVRVVITFCCTAMLAYIAVAFVLPVLRWGDTSVAWNRLLSILIYVPPLLMLVWSYRAALLAWLPRTRALRSAPDDALQPTHTSVEPAHLPGTPRRALKLWLYGIGMLVPLAGFAWRYPLGAHSTELTDIGKLAAYGRNEFVGYAVGVAVLFGLYLLALRESRRLTSRQVLQAGFGCGALQAFSMIWMYPVNAIDLFLYAVRSRLLTTYGVNPISVAFNAYPADSWRAFATPDWLGRVSPYGPLWNLVAAPVTALSGDQILVALIGYKLLAVICVLLGGWMIARTLRAAGRADFASGALMYLWNPLVLWEGVGNGHNDTLLALVLLLALFAWVKRRDGLVIPLLVVAALIKYISVPLIPLAAIALWRRADSGRARWRVAAYSFGLSLFALGVALYPFYDLSAIPASLQEQGTIIYTSPVAVALALLRQHYSFQQITLSVMLAGEMIVLLAMGWQMLRVFERPGYLPRACFELLYVLLLVGLASSRSWYLVWLVAIAALLPWGWPAWRAIAWTIGGLAGYGFFIWIEAWWQPGYDKAQIVGWLVIVGPTLLLTCIELVVRRSRRQRPTTNDQRSALNDQRPTTSDQRPTTTRTGA